MGDLNFTIDASGNPAVLIWEDGSRRPATDPELELWAELEALRERVRWIPVEERLPETMLVPSGKRIAIVMAYCAGCIEECRFIEGGQFVRPHGLDVTEFVSHWMPLPDNPPG